MEAKKIASLEVKGILEVSNYGTITVNGVELKTIITKLFGMKPDATYQSRQLLGTVKFSFVEESTAPKLETSFATLPMRECEEW